VGSVENGGVIVRYLFVLDGEGKLTEKTQWPGGGIANDETPTLTDSTVRANKAEAYDCFPSTCGGMGGGIVNDGTLTATNCTISGNAAEGGCGIFNEAALAMTASTLSGNSVQNGDAHAVGPPRGGSRAPSQ
jgi:hypothetical protein